MPITARIDLNPGLPPCLTVLLKAADGTESPLRSYPFEQHRQAVVPLLPGLAPVDLARMLARIRSRNPAAGDVPSIGKFLFGLLFDGIDWRNAAAAEQGKGPIELVLEIADRPELRTLHNQPWESLHDGTTFLAVAAPRPVALTRTCGGAQAAVRLNPRVLFVVGDEMSEDQLRPGAEYYSVLRRLETDKTRLHTRILLRASLSRITREMQEFDPAIVHFVCHGAVGTTGGYLLMYDDTDRRGHQVFAIPLITALRAGVQQNRPLPVVVLTACDSARLPADVEKITDVRDPTRSLAEELARAGVPLVVGMSGRVSARACRLFAREFYATVARPGAGGNALLTDAAARGRYWALTEAGSNPDRSVDWAMPVVFRRDRETVTVDWAQYTEFEARVTLADSFRKITNPPLLCDRVDTLAAYRGLIRAEPGAVLAVRLTAQHPKGKPARYGLSRMLEELAYVAALDGHLPCLVRRAKDPPHNLLVRILEGIETTRTELGLGSALPGAALAGLNQRIRGDATAQLPPEFEQQLILYTTAGGQPDLTHPKVLRAAVEVDLRQLAVDAALNKSRHVVLLIEDLHWYNEAGIGVAETWLSRRGLAATGTPIPLVIGYTILDRADYQGVPGAINLEVERQKGYVGRVDVDHFAEANTDPLPYLQLLLGLDPPRVISPRLSEERRQKLIERIARATDRVPSFFEVARNDRLDEAISIYSDSDNGGPSLIVADDEAFVRGQTPPGS